MPLTSSFEDDGDEGSESQWIGGGGGGVTSPTNNAHAFAEDDPFYMFRGDLVKKLLLVDGELDRYLTVVRNTVSDYLVLGCVYEMHQWIGGYHLLFYFLRHPSLS